MSMKMITQKMNILIKKLLLKIKIVKINQKIKKQLLMKKTVLQNNNL